jgi:hypothetical protein
MCRSFVSVLAGAQWPCAVLCTLNFGDRAIGESRNRRIASGMRNQDNSS